MGNNEVANQDALNQFIEDRYCLELVRFWGAHPRARFNRLAVIHAFNQSDYKPEFERALVQLMSRGVVKVTVENGTHLYSLTEDEPLRSQVLELASLGWHYQQRALTKVHPLLVEAGNQRQVGYHWLEDDPL
jgi:hypothetical protein